MTKSGRWENQITEEEEQIIVDAINVVLQKISDRTEPDSWEEDSGHGSVQDFLTNYDTI